ncbi:MAG TPA: hypothetical protein VF992_04545 [Thermoplasmata archaeon]
MSDIPWIAAIGAGAAPVIEILFLAFRTPHARQDPGTDELILEYGRGLKVFAIFAVSFFSFLGALYVWTFLTAPDRGELSPFLIILVIAPLLLLSTVLGLEMFRTLCRLSRTQIIRHSPWSGDLSLDWWEISSIEYDTFARWWVIRSPRGKIRLHDYLSGRDDFLRLAHQQIPPDRWGRAAKRS